MHIIHKQLRRLTFDNNLIYAQKPQKSLHSLYTHAYKGVCNWTWSWHQKRPFRTIYETPIWAYIYVYMYISLVACVRPSSAKLIYLRGTTDMTENSDSLLPPIYTHEPHIYYALHYYYTFGNFLVVISSFSVMRILLFPNTYRFLSIRPQAIVNSCVRRFDDHSCTLTYI